MVWPEARVIFSTGIDMDDLVLASLRSVRIRTGYLYGPVRSYMIVFLNCQQL